MKNGFQIYDADTHVSPAAELAFRQLHRRLVQEAAQQHRVEVEGEIDRDPHPRRVAEIGYELVPGGIGPGRLPQFR